MSIIRSRGVYDELTIYDKQFSPSGIKYKPSNEMILFCSMSGYGKTLAVSKTNYEYWRNGFTIINITDVKRNFEGCFSMLNKECVPSFHRYKVENIQKEEFVQIPLKIYHPFTFNIPSRKLLPDINFFTLSLKSLNRNHFSFLSETKTNSETVKLMLYTTERLKSNDGFFDFMRLMSEQIEDKTSVFQGKKIKKINQDFGIPMSSSGTVKDIQQIQSYLLPFKTDYFLGRDNASTNIDFVEMINDQKHYHSLTYKWIKDEKVRYFAILNFLLGIEEALDHAKHPVLIVIDEIRFLVPDKATGFAEFMSVAITNALSTMRNKGRGTCVVAGSQVFYNISETVRNSFNTIYLGRLPAIDVERLAKVNAWNQARRQLMISLKKNHFHKVGEQDTEEFTLLFPPHPHKEPHLKFEEVYHKQFPHREKKYGELMKKMEKQMNKEFAESKKIVEKKQRQMKEDLKKLSENKEKQSGAVKELRQIKEEQKIQKEGTKQELMQKCYDLYTLEGIESFSEIGRQLGLSSPTVKTYLHEFKRKQEEKDSIPKLK